MVVPQDDESAMTSKPSKRGKAADLAPAYEPTPRERAAMEGYLARRRENPPAPQLKVVKKRRTSEVSPDHPEPALGQVLLMEALGTEDTCFLNGLVSQLVNAGSQGPDADERGINFMLSVIKGVQPQDEIEAMLGAQMAAVHSLTMTFARRLAHVDTIQQQDSAERAFNKLARTFATQIEALKRYRTGGEQRVTVRHVTVNDGGQAIVGSVEAGGGGERNPVDNPMHPRRDVARLQAAPRCGAHTRGGEPCRAPAVRGRHRCRMHGGAPGSGAPSGPRNGMYRHGMYTREAMESRRALQLLLREARATCAELMLVEQF